MTESDLPKIIGGKYRPIRVIGLGAMGVVYSVEHLLTGEHLALKVMMAHQGASREAIERFKREARASSKIRSEHVVRVLDADVSPELEGAPYLVMDLLEGMDLEQISDEKMVEPVTVVEWLRQIARPLDKAHRLGIVHRDLKPENLFLTQREDGSALIKLLDFGIAKIAAESIGTTQSGQILGTPLYMAPEQARGDPSLIGPPTDLYALGLIAYKLLTSTPYWKGTSVAEIVGEILYEPIKPPSASGWAFGPEFDGWFLRACNRDPKERFTSAVEQVEALARALRVSGKAASRTSSFPPEGFKEAANKVSDRVRATASASSRLSLGPKPDEGITTLRQSEGTLASSSLEMPKSVKNRRSKGRRLASYLALTAILLSMLIGSLVVVLYRRRHSLSPPTATHAPIATESVVAMVAATLPPAIAQPSAAPSMTTRSADEPAFSPVAAESTSKKSATRLLVPRTSAPVVSPRRERSLLDDALSDQK